MIPKNISECLVCKNETFSAIDLGMHPFADTFIAPEQYGKSEPVLPLRVDVCENCGNAQTSCRTDPIDRYNLYEYSYTSSNSAFSRSYWEEYAKFLQESYCLKGMFILEIGSNDGYLLSILKDKGAHVFGIDASGEMVSRSQKLGIEVHQCIFGTEELPRELCDKRFDLILANNVLNHSDDPVSFVSAVSSFLKNDGVFIAEQPYWPESLSSMKLDQIYHEHVTYISVKSAKTLFSAAGLNLCSTFMSTYHGGSIRLIASKNLSIPEDVEITNFLEKEQEQGIFQKSFYQKLMRAYEKKRIDILSKILQLRKENDNIKIVGFGAAAKGNTFLNYLRLDSTLVDFLVDISPSKIGKFTPLTRIPIFDEKELSCHTKVVLIPLSWNLPDHVFMSVQSKYKNVEWL